ncbi:MULTISPECIES: hypothetical protein [Sporosarcina]|uniref:hypothetical protein n=1 Tax=Sporosarcina TaxID=1569 RepID=UPI00129A13F6|nr:MULTISPECIES: hypothetical protein [Sporosarcina]GKV66002.1 hypothetical protein NCCP2331_21550 [Sporosarcina sp. NCCP-2331]GLB56572.1 hypothetical protein NCCP2378_23590 [Sporosarcina sp. NCCP-2378]
MRKEEPLLFIQNPVIRKFIYTPAVEEESTSIFEMENVREDVQEDVRPETEEVIEEQPSAVNLNIQHSLDFLNHSFRKELYQPIEIVTEEGVNKGRILEIKDGYLSMQENDETISIEIKDIQEIKWKQQSFVI